MQEIVKKIANDLWLWFKLKSRSTRYLLAAIFCLLLFMFTRIGYFGSPLAELSKRVLPVGIPIIDKKTEPLRVNQFNIVVHDACNIAQPKAANSEMRVFDGDTLQYHISLNNDAYVAFLIIDNMGWNISPFQPKGPISEYTSEFYATNERNSIIKFVHLDNTNGNEIHTLLFSNKEFDVSRIEIIANILLIDFNAPKGETVSAPSFFETEDVFARSFTFRHEPRSLRPCG